MFPYSSRTNTPYIPNEAPPEILGNELMLDVEPDPITGDPRYAFALGLERNRRLRHKALQTTWDQIRNLIPQNCEVILQKLRRDIFRRHEQVAQALSPIPLSKHEILGNITGAERWIFIVKTIANAVESPYIAWKADIADNVSPFLLQGIKQLPEMQAIISSMFPGENISTLGKRKRLINKWEDGTDEMIAIFEKYLMLLEEKLTIHERQRELLRMTIQSMDTEEDNLFRHNFIH